MKKKIVVIVSALLCLIAIGYYTFPHFIPHFKLVGSWTGDGTLDLLGDSPFDGAVEITFNLDRTGYIVTQHGNANFTFEVQSKYGDVIILEDTAEHTYGLRFYIDGKSLSIDSNDEIVSFTRK